MWGFFSDQIKVMKMDRQPDAAMLEGVCVAYQKAVAADILLQKFLDGGCCYEEPVLNKEGEEIGVRIKSHPANAVSEKNWRLVKAFCVEFGFSPASRQRVRGDKPFESWGSDLKKLLSNGPKVERPGAKPTPSPAPPVAEPPPAIQ
jgi:hypothetical protein